MPLPNVSGVQQAGVDPLSVQKKGDNNQAIMNLIREIQTRLDNIMNVRGNVQAGIYGAFGNNFLSRGMIGITDAITDSIGSLFADKEEEKDDPITKAIKQQTVAIQEVASKIEVSGKSSERVTDEIVLLRRDIKQTQELQHADTIDQDKILEQILDALGGATRVSQTQTYDDDQVFGKVVDSLKNIGDTQVERTEKTETPIDVESKEAKDEVKEVEQKKKQSNLLKKIFDTLTSMSKNLDKLVNAQPMSTREAELEAMRVKRDQLDNRTGVEDIKTVDEGGKRGFDWTRLFTGLLDFDANLRGFKNIFGFVINAMKSGITGLIGAITPVISIITKLGTTVASVIASLAGKAMGAAGTIAQAGLGIVKKAMPYAIPAAIMGAAGAGVDYLAGQVGVGNKEIDEAQDEANWAKMGFFEKLESGTARGIEKVGSFLSLDNLSNEARASRIKSETEYLKKKTAGEGLNQIEVTQEDIRKTERLKETQRSGSSAAPVIQDNRVTQNQTIMPTRTVVENQEPAYRRYVNNILSPAR